MADPYPWDEQQALKIAQGSPNYWESPAIWVGPNKGDTTVRSNFDNLVNVEVQRATGKTFNEAKFRVQAFMANPCVFVIKAKMGVVANALVDKSELDSGFHLFQKVWRFDNTGLTDDHPFREGHKCMNVRVFPDAPENRWPKEFTGDPHEALRNMGIVSTAEGGGGPGGVGQGLRGVPGSAEPVRVDGRGVAEYLVEMVNTSPLGADSVRIRGITDLPPDAQELVAAQLKLAGYDSLAELPPEPEFLPEPEFDLPKEQLPTYWEPESLVADGVEPLVDYVSPDVSELGLGGTRGVETLAEVIAEAMHRSTDVVAGHYARGLGELAKQIGTSSTARGGDLTRAVITLGEQLRTGMETMSAQLTTQLRDLGAVLTTDRPLPVESLARELRRAGFVPSVGRLVDLKSDAVANEVTAVVDAPTTEVTRFSLKVPMGEVLVGLARAFDLEQVQPDGTVVGGMRLVLVRGLS